MLEGFHCLVTSPKGLKNKWDTSQILYFKSLKLKTNKKWSRSCDENKLTFFVISN